LQHLGSEHLSILVEKKLSLVLEVGVLDVVSQPVTTESAA